MARKYLDTAVVDVTFSAWWTEYGRRPGTVGRALKRTKDLIQGPMPPNYVPPPWRKNSRASGQSMPRNGPSSREIERARQMAGSGRRMLEKDIKTMVAEQFPGLPYDVARQIQVLPCYVNPRTREAKVRAILQSNRDKIEDHNLNSNPSRKPKYANGRPRNMEREYEQRAAERDAIASLQRHSSIFNGADGLVRARALLANRQALMLLDLNYLTKNTFAAGFYGIARQAGADHDSAMEIGRRTQNILEVAGGFTIAAKGYAVRGGGGYVPPPSWTNRVRTGNYFSESGMSKSHFAAFRKTAKATGKIAVVRFSKTAAIKLIEQGYPAKGMDLSKVGIKCAESTGIATARGPTQTKAARQLGYFVVDTDGVARNQAGQPLKFDGKPSWKLQRGQVIHPKQKKPLVSDYDLLDVIDAKALGRRLVLATSGGKTLPDQTNPMVKAFASAVNRNMDQPRVLHGAHADFSGLPNEGAIVFRPDGSAMLLPNRAAVHGFYSSMGRPTRNGSHSPSGVKVGVE